MKNIRVEMPVITSGITRGAVTMPENRSRPRNLGNRASASPAIVPRMVATVAEISAICTDRISAAPTCRLENNDTYHLVENPPQTVASREPLKE